MRRVRWEAERALKAAVPTAWLVKGGAAFALVRFPPETEPGERWTRGWVAAAWVFSNGLFGLEAVAEDARFTAVACPQHSEKFADVEEVHVLLNTEPVVGLRLRGGAVEVLRGWALALKDKAAKKRAVRRARRTEYCQDL